VSLLLFLFLPTILALSGSAVFVSIVARSLFREGGK
jgi:hypothetical protein